MGLDMYCYSINKELVAEDDEVGGGLFPQMYKAVGFEVIDNLDSMSDHEKNHYWIELEKARDKAKKLGLVDYDFYYWRKFNALHGWMEGLYYRKGGTSKSFNCNTVRLRAEDIELLEDAIIETKKGTNKGLKSVPGFFFGSSEIDPEDIKDLEKFIALAKLALANGKALFYDSWW